MPRTLGTGHEWALALGNEGIGGAGGDLRVVHTSEGVLTIDIEGPVLLVLVPVQGDAVVGR